MNPSHTSEGTYDPNGLIAGSADIVTRDITIATSAALLAGAVLGMVTATGKYILSASASTDGSQVPRAILAADADASAADVIAPIYDAGEFDQDKLNFGAGHSIATVQEDLRAVGIHLKNPVVA
jgi:hypothetical protein